jgi:hypothetical protein
MKKKSEKHVYYFNFVSVSVVAEQKSCYPPWIVSQEEIDASKLENFTVRRNGVDPTLTDDNGDNDNRRAVRKRVPISMDDQPLAKKSCDGLENESEEETDDESSADEVDPEIGETQAKYRVKKWVTEKLALRVTGEVFLQDGPCFQVSKLLPELDS